MFLGFVKMANIEKVSNHDWYTRRGYQVIRTVQNHYGIVDADGKLRNVNTVFMRRDIT